MLALVQRVAQARVEVAGRVAGAISRGLLVFVCAEPQDTPAIADKLVAKLLKLRVFADAAGRMNIVSQFTLAADLSGGNRPSFTGAAPAESGRVLYAHLLARASALHAPVAAGEFGADMQVHLVNDGPVTIPVTLRQ
jgi:D-tyrosyl-tRNA(Tyr) deacylase